MEKLSGKKFNVIMFGRCGWEPSGIVLTIPAEPYTHYLLNRYDADNYQCAIVEYLKACGATIEYACDNLWDDRFYVSHTPITRDIDPVSWYDHKYRKPLWHNYDGLANTWLVVRILLVITIPVFLGTVIFKGY